MVELAELSSSELMPLKRSVFRADVLQREIERRDGPVSLEEVPHLSGLTFAVCAFALLLGLGGLLAIPVALSTQVVFQPNPMVSGSYERFHMRLQRKDVPLILRGGKLVLDSTGVQPRVFQIVDVTLDPGDAGKGQAETALTLTTQSQNTSTCHDCELNEGLPTDVVIRTRFVHCLTALWVR